MDLEGITTVVYIVSAVCLTVGAVIIVLWARASRRSADPECRACGRFIMRGRLCAHCERHRSKVGAR